MSVAGLANTRAEVGYVALRWHDEGVDRFLSGNGVAVVAGVAASMTAHSLGNDTDSMLSVVDLAIVSWMIPTQHRANEKWVAYFRRWRASTRMRYNMFGDS